jgi:hypothetical protein
MDSMLYPTFEIVPDRGVLPRVYLPKNFKNLVPKFYKEGRMRNIAHYSKELEKIFLENTFNNSINLCWDKKRGLTSITIGSGAGLDLEDKGLPKFQEHNLGNYNGYLAGLVAMKYVSELLKSE